MSEKAKNILLGVLIVGLVSMTVAYAALSQTLTINGSAKVQGRDTSWHVRFDNSSPSDLSACPAGTTAYVNGNNDICLGGYATLPSNSVISLTDDSTLATLPQVTLKAPGDVAYFKWNVKNEGEINAILTGVTPISLGDLKCGDPLTTTCTGSGKPFADSTAQTEFVNDIEVTFTYAGGTAFAANSDKLAKNGGSAEVMVKIEYKKTQANQVLPAADVTFDGITAALVYGQDTNN